MELNTAITDLGAKFGMDAEMVSENIELLTETHLDNMKREEQARMDEVLNLCQERFSKEAAYMEKLWQTRCALFVSHPQCVCCAHWTVLNWSPRLYVQR